MSTECPARSRRGLTVSSAFPQSWFPFLARFTPFSRTSSLPGGDPSCAGGFSPRVAVGLAPVHRCRLVLPGLFVLCGSVSFGAPLAVLGGAASAGAGLERGLALGAPLAAVGDGPDRWWPG